MSGYISGPFNCSRSSLALGLSKGCPFVVRQAHHERAWNGLGSSASRIK